MAAAMRRARVTPMNTTRRLNKLINETEGLLAEISDERGPHIEAARDRLVQSLERTRSAINEPREGDPPHSDARHLKVRHVAASLNDYVKGYPWLALATGVLVASTIGILATSATRRSYNPNA
jgi:ElaB/YqjD/DUF883 family membrane-anchored ribosome-binding protein